MTPTGEEITEAIRALQKQSPNIGRKKLVAQLNADKGWSLTSKDLKEHLPQESESGEGAATHKDNDKPEPHKDNDKSETKSGPSHDATPRADSPQQKYNCFLIRAKPHSSTPPLQDIPNQVEPFNLNSFGDEMGEMRELKTRLRWKNAREVGKFYDHKGTDSWYYYIYGEEGSSQPMNEAASLVCYKKMKGDIAVIRSGPAGTDTPEYFTQRELSEAVEFYKTHDRSKVFHEREKSRMSRSMGINLGGVPHFYYNETSQGGSFSRTS